MKKALAVLSMAILLLLSSCVSMQETSVAEQFTLRQSQKAVSSVGLLIGSVSYGAGYYFPTTSDILDISLLKTDQTTGLLTEISHMRYRNFQKFPVSFSVRYDKSDIQDGDMCSLLITLSVDGTVTAQGMTVLSMKDGELGAATLSLVSL